MSKRQECHDCGVYEGWIHEYGCDMEYCPVCGQQLIGCVCCYHFLGVDASEGSWAYSHGLTAQQTVDWIQELDKIGRIPYFLLPNMCMRCGGLWPEMFSVSDERWKAVVEPLMRHRMLCRPCFDEMELLIP